MSALKTTYTSTDLAPELDTAFDAGVEWARASVGEHRLYVGGEWRDGGGEAVVQRNPSDREEELGTFAAATEADVDAAVAAARSAQAAWARLPVAERVGLLAQVGEVLQRRVGEIGGTVALEVGKQRVESVGEVEEVVELFRVYSAQVADGLEQPLEPASPDDLHRSVLRPFGVFGVIAPFNFPLALTAGPASAALLAGNTVVVKPSPTTSWTGVLLAEAFAEAGAPPGVLNVVTGADETGRALVAADLDGIVFTGSYAVGMEIARTFAAGGRYPRPVIAEMGGKNPAIVGRSADLEAAAAGIARSAFGLSGQKCSACSRVLVHESVHDELVELLVERAAEWLVADPVRPEARLGPVHTQAAYDRYADVVEEASRDGAVAFGGRTLRDGDLARGWFVEPTVVTDLPVGHRLTREELFVPVVVVERVGSIDEALARANGQVYGLTAGLFSEDPAEIDAFLDRIEAGTVFVNRAAGATSGGWPGQQTYPGWKGSGSTGRGALGLRYVAQFLREQGHTVVGRRA